MHSVTKSLLFISVIGLTDVSGKSRDFFHLTGAAYRNKIAGVGFLIGSLSMVGIPLFGGFISKMMYGQAAVQAKPIMMFPALVVLALSTILNAIYFLKTVLRIYTPESRVVEEEKGYVRIHTKDQKQYTFTIALFILLNFILGTCSKPILDMIVEGLHNFM
jgi:multicomponent Na+:H+ antiporter subunit D